MVRWKRWCKKISKLELRSKIVYGIINIAEFTYFRYDMNWPTGSSTMLLYIDNDETVYSFDAEGLAEFTLVVNLQYYIKNMMT